jgi:hypothetical protein
MIRRRPLEETGDDRDQKSSVNIASHLELLTLLNIPEAAHATDSGSIDSNDESTTHSGSVIEIMEDEEESKATYGKRLCWSFRVVLLLSVLCALAIATSLWLVPVNRSSTLESKILDKKRRNDLPVDFECPLSSQKPANAEDDSFERDYGMASRQITTNVTEFLEVFRSAHFDDWGHSYEEVKAGMEEFKARYYSPYLHNGSAIYESACGIGLNLYMTLEILRDYANLTNLVVYGNEYVRESVTKANWVLERVPPAEGKRGVICVGDSSNLSHVPSNAFDLVYTGYLTPLLDPLNLHPDDEYTSYNQICDALDDTEDWMGKTLNNVMQQRQEDWFGKWVGEMARIAKPGVPVIVEQVSLPYCLARHDWGGVDRDFWISHAKANTYHWNINPKSIEFAPDTIFKSRYHVFMLKNT